MHSQLQEVIKNQYKNGHPQYSLLENNKKQYQLNDSSNSDINKQRRKSCEGMIFGYESNKTKLLDASYPQFQIQHVISKQSETHKESQKKKKLELRKQKRQLLDQLTPIQFNQTRMDDENPLYLARKEIKNSINSRVSSFKISKMINFDQTDKEITSKVVCKTRGYLPTRIKSNFLSQTYQFSLQTFAREGFSDYCSLQTEETQEQTNSNQTSLKQNEPKTSQKVSDFIFQHRLNPNKTITKFLDQQLFIETGEQQKQIKIPNSGNIQLNFYQTNLLKKKSSSIFTPTSQLRKSEFQKIVSSYTKLRAQLHPSSKLNKGCDIETPKNFKIKKMRRQFSQHLSEKENNFCIVNIQEPFRSNIVFKNDDERKIGSLHC